MTDSVETSNGLGRARLPAAFTSGGLIGILGGMIVFGGAKFRLPILISLFRFHALEAVILNKATSLIVVATGLPFRAATVPLSEISSHWSIIMNLLCGSLLGAWVGAGWATRLHSQTLYKIIAILLVIIIIGVVASLLGVAGGEVLIPTLVLLFGADIKLAGSLSLAISLPTMLVGFARYSRDQSFSVLGRNKLFLLVMVAGSIVGTFIGGRLLGLVPNYVLLPILAALLLRSAVKMWGHSSSAS